ncbi:diacylglycerol kinase [Diaminobutyricibacter tongyongensis]|uniref:Diacylglycerol kinase n=1 Tax=Leifsonia tongyongensis TaxID=1268043 RepID=A0A6L9XTZ1_9MICO|nr:diacylglycerol kinase family protein [Diaminobutyricibacter tongyongensis]NEN04776.1 diacylglycerol kinase [Diaminobutyricibacter tongyongensis]
MSNNHPKVAAVIYNPIKVDLDALREVVAAEAVAAGWGETIWKETTVEDVGQGVTQEALDHGADLIIVAGGDGTVRAVAEAVRGSDAVVALVPSGTGNLLARNLKLVLDDMKASIHAAFTGTDRQIDLGMIDIERDDSSRDRHAFVVMAGMGIDAKMIQNTDEDLKAKAGWAAYVDAIAKSLRDPDELHLDYQLDDGKRRRATLDTIIIGNCGSLPGKIVLMPDAVVDDGVFDLLMMRPQTALGWIRVWFEIAWINGVVRRTKAGKALNPEPRNSGLRYQTGTRFTARLSRPEEIELDGDEFGKATAFKAWLEPGALTVRVPADASS